MLIEDITQFKQCNFYFELNENIQTKSFYLEEIIKAEAFQQFMDFTIK